MFCSSFLQLKHIPYEVGKLYFTFRKLLKNLNMRILDILITQNMTSWACSFGARKFTVFRYSSNEPSLKWAVSSHRRKIWENFLWPFLPIWSSRLRDLYESTWNVSRNKIHSIVCADICVNPHIFGSFGSGLGGFFREK